jgi:hypothetical protein
VYKNINAGGLGELAEGCDYGTVGEEVSVEIAGFDIEDVNENTDIREDMLPLLRKIIFHECILSIEALAFHIDFGRFMELRA